MRPYLRLFRRNPDYRRVQIATLVTLGGDWFALIPLLNLLARETGSGVWGGIVLATETLLLAAASPYAGTIADRVDRQVIMIVTEVVSAACVLSLLLVRGPATAWIAVLAMGAIAVLKAFNFPSATAAMPNLVRADDLPAANAVMAASWGAMLVIGAALGGLADALVGPQTCFLIDAVSFLISAALIARARGPFQQVRTSGGTRPRPLDDVLEALRYVRRDPRVAGLVTVKSGVGLGNGTLVMFPLLAATHFHAGGIGTGLLFAARGLGALIGPFLLRRYSTDEGRRWHVLAGCMLLYSVSYVAFAATPWLWLALGLVTLAHLGGGANWAMSTYGLQTCVPDALRGRVFSLDFMVAMLAIGVSQLAAGLLSDIVDPRPLVTVLAGITGVYAVLWWLATAPARRAASAAAAGPSSAPPTAREMLHGDEPPL